MNTSGVFTAKAWVCLDAKQMFGHEGWRTGVRPNHRIPGRGNEMFMGMLTFSDREWLRPGQCAEATVRFMVMPADVPLFVPGFWWELCEGPHVVGRAEVLELLDA
jgi:hypothetical protein